MAKVFISYRRSDSAPTVGRIYDRLIATFGEDNVFKDVYAIPLGVDFRARISKAVAECKVLLVIIGDGWLDACDDQGNRRLFDLNDFVRIEIESALARGIPVIPVLLDHVEMPSAKDLPDSMRDLAYRNATSMLPDPHFATGLDRLIKGIEEEIKPVRRNSSRVLISCLIAAIVIAFACYFGRRFFDGTENQTVGQGDQEVPINPHPSQSDEKPSSPELSDVAKPTVDRDTDVESFDPYTEHVSYYIQSLPSAVEESGASVVESALQTWAGVSSFGGARVLQESEATLIITAGPTPFVEVTRPQTAKEKWRVVFDGRFHDAA